MALFRSGNRSRRWRPKGSSQPPGHEDTKGAISRFVPFQRTLWECLRGAGPWVWGAAALLAGALLRLWGLGGQGFWRDEAQGLFIAAKGFPGGIVAALARDGHPPLYYFIMHFWMLAFGRGELAVQLFSALCGLGAIAVVYALGRRLYGQASGLGAAFFAVLLPMHIQLSRTARMYSLVSLAASLVVYLAYVAVSRGGAARYAGLALASVALVYSHNWGVLMVGAVNVWWATLLLIHPPARRSWRAWIASQAAVGLAYLPWLPVLGAQRSALVVAATWTETGSRIGNLFRLLNELTSLALPHGRSFVWVGLVLLGLVSVRISRKEVALHFPLEPATLLLACTFAVPLVLGLLITPKSVGIIPSYVTIVVYPALCVILGRGVLGLRRWWAVAAAVAVVLGLWVAPLRTVETVVTSNLREVAAHVQARAAPGDVIIVAPDYLATTFNYYYRGPQAQVAFPMPPGRTEEIVWADYGQRWQRAGEQIEPTLAFVEAALGPGGRLWLVGPVESYPKNPLFEQIRALKSRLDARYRLVEAVTRFRGPVETADVYVYERGT